MKKIFFVLIILASSIALFLYSCEKRKKNKKENVKKENKKATGNKSNKKTITTPKPKDAPTFTAEDIDGNKISTADFKAKKILIIYFWSSI